MINTPSVFVLFTLVISFVAMALDFSLNKKIQKLSILAFIVFVVALLVGKKENTVPLILTLETLFLIEKGNIRRVFLNFIYWTPVLIVLVMGLSGTELAMAALSTVFLKNITWPLLIEKEVSELSFPNLMSKFIFPIYFWSQMELGESSLWILGLMGLACFVSLNTTKNELLLFSALSLVTLNKDWSLIALSFSFLFFLETRWNAAVVLLLAFANAMVWAHLKDFMFDWQIPLAIVISLCFARVLAFELKRDKEVSTKIQSLYIVMTLLVIGAAFLISLDLQNDIFFTNTAFAQLSLILFSVLGWFFYSKSTKIFHPFNGFELATPLAKKIYEIDGKERNVTRTKLRNPLWTFKYLDYADRESHILFVLGIIAVLLVWYIKR